MWASTWRGEQCWGLVCTVVRGVGVRCGPQRRCAGEGGGVKCAKWARTWRGEQGWGLVCTVFRVVSVQSGPQRGCAGEGEGA